MKAKFNVVSIGPEFVLKGNKVRTVQFGSESGSAKLNVPSSEAGKLKVGQMYESAFGELADTADHSSADHSDAENPAGRAYGKGITTSDTLSGRETLSGRTVANPATNPATATRPGVQPATRTTTPAPRTVVPAPKK